MKKKLIATILCTALIAIASVLATLAYLTDQDSVTNTFTVGKVNITLDEADVDKDGQLIFDDEGNPVERVNGNEYHLIPGKTYIKDPTVAVKEGSEASYIRMMLTINCLKELDAIFAPDGIDLTTVFGEYNPADWIYIGEVEDETENTITYEFRYKETVTGEDEDFALPALFKTFTLPGEITGEELETIKDLEIIVEAHAIQAAGFAANAETGETAEDVAWKAFDEQIAGN